MVPAVEAFTGAAVKYEKSGNTFQLSTTYKGVHLKMAVYENKDGTTTLSCMNGQDRPTFEAVATEIVEKSGIAAEVRLEVSLQKFSSASLREFLAYMRTLELQSLEEEQKPHHTQYKLVGKQGDTLTVKSFTNGTLQLQGRHALLASHALDFLTNVLPYKEAINLQLNGYDIHSTVDAVLHELSGHLPLSVGHLGDTVKAQLASALALTQTQLPLADFGAVAFPALRGLEGVLKSEMTKAGFDLSRFQDFGEYFESKVIGQYTMKPMHATVAKEPRATELAGCYTVYHKQRHGLAHMDADPETSRVLTSLDEAKTVVMSVFGTIEQFFKKTSL